MVASFTPQSAAGGPMRDGVLRSFAAIYDGHNGAHSATYCSTRCSTRENVLLLCGARRMHLHERQLATAGLQASWPQSLPACS